MTCAPSWSPGCRPRGQTWRMGLAPRLTSGCGTVRLASRSLTGRRSGGLYFPMTRWFPIQVSLFAGIYLQLEWKGHADTNVSGLAFNPVVELDEVEVTFHRKAPAFRPVIHNRLLCATAGAPQLVWVTESLVDAMCDAFKELFAQTIEESRATFGFLGSRTNRESSRGDEGTRSAANDDAASHQGSSETSQGGLIPKLLPRPTSTPHSDSTYGSLVPMAETAILNNVGMELSTTETVTYNNVSLEDESTGESGSSHNARPVENHAGPDYCLGCSEPGIQCVCSTIWNFNPDISKDFGSGNPD